MGALRVAQMGTTSANLTLEAYAHQALVEGQELHDTKPPASLSVANCNDRLA